MIRSGEKEFLEEAQWRTYTDTLRICQNFYCRLKWEGFLIKNWDLRSKNYWYGWEKPTVIPASLCSHPVTPKSCKRKSWTSAYAQKFKTNFKHSYYSLGIMLWIRCLRSIYKNKWQILETIACDLSPGVTPCSGLNRGVRSNGVPFSSFRYIKG